MGLTAELLKAVPAAEKFRAALDAMEKENEFLKGENAELREELAQFIENWETLDGDAVRSLHYLAQYGQGHAGEISQACQMNIHLVESYLKHLGAGGYVHLPSNGEPHYALAPKGKRYLRERGLHK